MGVLDSLRRLATYSTVDALTPIRSPFSTEQLTRVVLSDITGLQAKDPGRADAMRVPPIVRGRALIALLSRHPLQVYDGTNPDPDAPPIAEAAPWLTSTNTLQSPIQRNLWTLDDLIFYGLSLWFVVRDDAGTIQDAVRVDRSLWSINPTTREVTIEGIDDLKASQVILFEGPQEGLITLAADTISDGRALQKALSDRIQTPLPMVELHSTDPNMDQTTDEAKSMVDAWETRRKAGGGTAYTPSNIEAKIHGAITADLFIEGRNALRLDVANFMNLPANLLEGSLATASLTYSTKEGSRNDFADFSLAYWAAPMEARLSQDDVVPAGQCVRFDLSQLASPIQPTHSPIQED